MTMSSKSSCYCEKTLVLFSSRWYLCARKSPYAFHPVSEKFPQRQQSKTTVDPVKAAVNKTSQTRSNTLTLSIRTGYDLKD